MRSKRVIIVTYYWPPSAGSGVQRWLKMSKYFDDFDVEAVIVTPKNPYYHLRDETLKKDIGTNVKVIQLPIREPYKIAEILTGKKVENTGKTSNEVHQRMSLSSKIQRYIRAHFFVPDPRKFWAKPTANFIFNYMKKDTVDAIITTGPPHSMHLIGLELKKKGIQIPWFADFRDPMSHIDFLKTLGVEGALLERYKRVEKKILDKADFVTGTTPSLPQQMEPFDSRKYRCVTNGYDSQDFNTPNSSSKGRYLFHAGLLNEFRNPIVFWKALNTYNKDRDPIKLVLAGTINPIVLQEIEKYPHVHSNLVNLGYISHQEVLRRYQESLANILLLNNTYNARVCIPGKLYELMAARRPLITIGSEDSDAKTILEDAKAGRLFDYDENESVILEYLLSLETEKSSPQDIHRYERRFLAKQYLELIYKDLI